MAQPPGKLILTLPARAKSGPIISKLALIFRTSSPGDVVVMIAVFLVLVAVWCAAGRLIGTHKAVTETLERVEHWLVPVVFIGLGLFILIDSGVIVRLVEVLA